MPSGITFDNLYSFLAGSYFSLFRLPLGVSIITPTEASIDAGLLPEFFVAFRFVVRFMAFTRQA